MSWEPPEIVVEEIDGWTWRVDFKCHLVNMARDPNRSRCGKWGNFSTGGSSDFFPCKRCLRAWESMKRERDELPDEPPHLSECRADRCQWPADECPFQHCPHRGRTAA